MRYAGMRYAVRIHLCAVLYCTVLCCVTAVMCCAGLYRGVVPTVQRAALLTATQLGTYDEIKHALLRVGSEEGKEGTGLFREGPLLHFVSGSVAGLGVSVVTSPVDTIRTRYVGLPLHCRYNTITYRFRGAQLVRYYDVASVSASMTS